MKKLYVLLVVLGLFIAPLASANLYGFMDGKLYDVNGTLKYICFLDGNCLGDDEKIYTREQVLGNNVSPDYSLAEPTVYNVNQDIPRPPAPAPTVEPVVEPTPEPTLLPAYTEEQLLRRIGVTSTLPNGGQILVFNTFCQAVSNVAARCSGSGVYSTSLTLRYEGKTVWDGKLEFGGVPLERSGGHVSILDTLTGLTPETTYSYDLVFTEAGREVTVIPQTFKTYKEAVVYNGNIVGWR